MLALFKSKNGTYFLFIYIYKCIEKVIHSPEDVCKYICIPSIDKFGYKTTCTQSILLYNKVESLDYSKNQIIIIYPLKIVLLLQNYH